jgi:hypothetical protein
VIDHFLDIYSKLVIGVISFIAPVTSYLLSTYLSDRHKILVRLEEQKTTIDKILESDLTEGIKKGQGARQTLEGWNAKLKCSEEQIDRNLKLLKFLNPKKRIALLFSALFFSIGLLLLNALVRGDVFDLYNHKISVWLIALSLSSFIFAMISLWQIAWKLIDARQIIVTEQREINNDSQSSLVQHGNIESENPEQPVVVTN